MATEGGRWFIISNFRLGQVVKWPLLMAWIKVLLTGLNRATWYYLASYVLLLVDREFSAAGCFLLGGWLGLMLRLTWHMPDVIDWLPASTVIPSLSTLRWLVVKVAMQQSSYSCPIDMRDPDCGWGKMWDVRDAWFNRGFRFISTPWVVCMIIPSGRITHGPFVIGCLLIHGVFALIYFVWPLFKLCHNVLG